MIGNAQYLYNTTLAFSTQLFCLIEKHIAELIFYFLSLIILLIFFIAKKPFNSITFHYKINAAMRANTEKINYKRDSTKIDESNCILDASICIQQK